VTRRFDLIAFDWDGTLFDSTALIVRCIQEACRDIGHAVPSDADAAYVIGLGLTTRCATPRRACRPSATPSWARATATTTSRASTSWCSSPARWRCCRR
jgi:phosphoglycolate phosphatase